MQQAASYTNRKSHNYPVRGILGPKGEIRTSVIGPARKPERRLPSRIAWKAPSGECGSTGADLPDPATPGARKRHYCDTPSVPRLLKKALSQVRRRGYPCLHGKGQRRASPPSLHTLQTWLFYIVTFGPGCHGSAFLCPNRPAIPPSFPNPCHRRVFEPRQLLHIGNAHVPAREGNRLRAAQEMGIVSLAVAGGTGGPADPLTQEPVPDAPRGPRRRG